MVVTLLFEDADNGLLVQDQTFSTLKVFMLLKGIVNILEMSFTLHSMYIYNLHTSIKYPSIIPKILRKNSKLS